MSTGRCVWYQGSTEPDALEQFQAIQAWWETLNGKEIIWQQRMLSGSSDLASLDWSTQRFDDRYIIQTPQIKGITLYWTKATEPDREQNTTPQRLELDREQQHLYIFPQSQQGLVLRITLPQLVYQTITLKNPEISTALLEDYQILTFKDDDKRIKVQIALSPETLLFPSHDTLAKVRALCDQYGILLIFDEVKTGLTAGPQGAAQRLGVKPDLISLAKSIGGGIPVAAFGGKREYMQTIVDGSHSHLGTFNGHYLAMAGIRAVDRICTPDALQRCENFNRQALTRIAEIINEYELPAHTVGFGVKGCITWSANPVRNYRDYRATDFELAELSFFWSLNRNVMTPPGLDEQWLISLAHGQREVDIIVGDFLDFAKALRA